MNLRPSARALIIDPANRVLLCGFEFVRAAGIVVVWAAPGGGVEAGESSFSPRGSMSDAELAAENVSGVRWWTLAELASYAGNDLFSPRALPALLPELLAGGTPAVPWQLGL